jgi:hypothetical protein
LQATEADHPINGQRRNSAKAALSPAEFLEGGIQVSRVEIRPHAIGEE